MAELNQMKCVACRGGEPTLTDEQVREFQPQVPEWQVKVQNGEKRLERAFKFKNFGEALAFTNKVGAAAEEEDHVAILETEKAQYLNR